MNAGDRSVPLADVVSLAAFGSIEREGTWVPDNARAKSVRELYRRGAGGMRGFISGTYARATFGAQFVEVAVDPRTGEVRVPRMVGAFAAGRILNETTTAIAVDGRHDLGRRGGSA